MFDFDFSKLMVIGIVALIFIPAKDLPRALRQLGIMIGKVRRMATEFQGQFIDAMKDADVASVKKDIEDATNFDVAFDPVNDVRQQITSTMDGLSRAVEEPELSASADSPQTPARTLPASPDEPLPAGHAPARSETELAGSGTDSAWWPEEDTASHTGDKSAAVVPEHSEHEPAAVVLPKMPAMTEPHREPDSVVNKVLGNRL